MPITRMRAYDAAGNNVINHIIELRGAMNEDKATSMKSTDKMRFIAKI